MTDEDIAEDLSAREKAEALWEVAKYNPVLSTFIIVFGFFVALLEGIGISFLIPIIEVAQGDAGASDDQLVQGFLMVYQTLGIPFTLGFIILGVSLVMVARFTSSFLVYWLQIALRTYYIRDIQTICFNNAIDARIAYFDEQGSDDILNAIVTQSEYAGKSIKYFVKMFQDLMLILMYLTIALIISPLLTIVAAITLGILTFLIRHVIEPGYTVGDRVAEGNERIQQAVQAGTQGIRDVKLYTMGQEVLSRFNDAVEMYTDASVRLGRNEAAIKEFYNMSAALVVFAMIFFALTFANLSLGALGVFLFAMFQLAPTVSKLNKHFYKLEGYLSHLVRTQEFVEEMKRNTEPNDGSKPVPSTIETVEFEDVTFSYPNGERALQDLSFEVNRGDFVAFVGQSGAGKSTIIKILSRMYQYDSGSIRADGIPITDFDVREWRSKIAVVRQDPFIFNETLRRNITVGKRDATESEIRRVCEIAHVDEFMYDLSDGLDTKLGDEGVKLSGGQRQRVSLARALLKDAEVLVLDEATSDLDTNIEGRVQRAIETMDRDYMTITIAHRLSTVVNADRIYTLEDGRITEAGEHSELIDNDGKYAQLYATQ
jgi:subfamily B ATP-binding cassette protein MsbA